MSKKLITNELIQERLTLKGFGDETINENEATALQNVLDHYGIVITDQWKNEFDFYIYEESTADGYTIWIATENINSIEPCENIYYYDLDLGYALNDFIRYSNGCVDYPETIYIDDISAEFINDTLRNMFWELQERLTDEVIDELIDEGYEEQED